MSNEIKKYDVLIIGGGAGGLFASTTANFFGLKNILIEQKPYLGGQPMDLYPNKYIYDFPCFKQIKSSEILKLLINQQKNDKFNTLLLNTTIKDVQKKEEDEQFFYQITLDNDVFLTKNIIIATGYGNFNPKKLEINNIIYENDFIHYSVNMNKNIYLNKKIVVLGGGDSAVDWANYFVEEKISNNVTIIHRRDQYRCSSIMVDELNKNKVNQKLNYEVLGINLENKILTIKHNLSNEIENINYDYLIVQYGQVPSKNTINLFNELKKEKNKLVVDINQKTNLPYIYGIGDAIIYEYKANTIVTTCADGTKAIWHIAKNKDRKW